MKVHCCRTLSFPFLLDGDRIHARLVVFCVVIFCVLMLETPYHDAGIQCCNSDKLERVSDVHRVVEPPKVFALLTPNGTVSCLVCPTVFCLGPMNKGACTVVMHLVIHWSPRLT